MYIVIRYLFLGVCIVLFWMVRKRIKFPKTVIIIVLLINAVIWNVPVENIFLRFDTPEEAYRYAYSTRQIVHKYESDIADYVVLHGDINGTTFSQVPKDEKGYLAFSPHTQFNSRISTLSGETGLYSIYLIHDKSNVNFIHVSCDTGEIASIGLTNNTPFYKTVDTSRSIPRIGYYAFFQQNTNAFEVIINGETFKLQF